MLRFLLGVIGLWSLFFGIIQGLHQETSDCGVACWHQLRVGDSDDRVRQFLRHYDIPYTEKANGYEWGSLSETYSAITMVEDGLMRLDVSWKNDPNRPRLGEVLPLLGAPDLIRVESRVVSNVRGLDVTLLYKQGDVITYLKLARVSNDPALFGEFRLAPDDEIFRMSHYQSSSETLSASMVPWRGFARYPVHQVCC